MKILFISSLLILSVYGNMITTNDLHVIIEAVNSKAGAKWKAGYNFVQNTTLLSMKRLLGVKGRSPRVIPLREKHLISESEIPEQFDSRERWPECESICQIRNQGNCGSCWAVAAAAAFTDRLCIATEGNFTLPISAQELLSCCSACGEGCEGGYMYEAWRFMDYNGIVTGGEYNSSVGCQPYEIGPINEDRGSFRILPEPDTPVCKMKCTNPSYPKPFQKDHHRIYKAYTISEDVKEIQKEIMKHGPVEAGFTVYADFMTYASGIYHYVTGEELGGHAVKIIGWGVEEGTPYWLVANEWGETWGEKGFFRILRGHKECNIESEIVAGIPKI